MQVKRHAHCLVLAEAVLERSFVFPQWESNVEARPEDRFNVDLVSIEIQKFDDRWALGRPICRLFTFLQSVCRLLPMTRTFRPRYHVVGVAGRVSRAPRQT